MRILFDQGTPLPIKKYLPGHSVTVLTELRWDRLKNGELLAAAEQAGFDLFLTTDKNLKYQQNLASRSISIVVLGHGQWPTLKRMFTWWSNR